MANHFSATINRPGHQFPLYGEATRDGLAAVCNFGDTPAASQLADPEFLARLDSLAEAVRADRTVTVGAVVVSPIDAATYERIR